jgi:hypothetical protein
MILLRPLFEAWLLKATGTPLAPWQRQLLLWALERDEQLRRFALELAELAHEEQAPAHLKAPDLRASLHAAIHAERPASPAWQPNWSWAGAAVVFLAIGAGLWWQAPQRETVEVAAVRQENEAALLRLPSATPSATATPTVTPSATPTPSPSPSPTRTATPAP